MAKSKGKAMVAATVGPLKVEAAGSNDCIAEAAPSESVQVQTEAATGVLDKSEGAETIKGANDLLDQSEEMDKKEETDDDLEHSEEENENGDEEADENPEESEEEAEENEKVESRAADAVPEGENDEENKEVANEIGKVESVAADVVPEGEKVKEVDNKGEDKDGKTENLPKKKARRTKKKMKAASGGADKPGVADKAGSSAAETKDKKLADGMGLIFMCNAKTKKDCFQYKVFGLPESKKELVSKVYKGMRLFLFDVDLKLMYGIYRAAGPGGYNIEPKAFKSAFPSQVRFDILDDCSPLPEEKFRPAIKENYYGKNKFNCQLSLDQVKSLCKLFKSAGKLPKATRPRDAVRAEPPKPSSARARKRSRLDEPAAYARDRKMSRRDEQKRPHHRERGRREPVVSTGRGRREAYGDMPPFLAAPRREAYRSPPRPLALPPPLPPVPYAYDRPVDNYYYRRDPRPLDPRDPRVMDLAPPRPLAPPPEYPYGSLYREPVPYREPLYAPPTAPAPSAVYGPPSLYYRY